MDWYWVDSARNAVVEWAGDGDVLHYFNSPAALAGVKMCDKIIERDGQVIKTVGDLMSLPGLQIGQEIQYKFTRVRFLSQALIF